MADVTLQAGREKPVRQRHPWIFSGAIREIAEQAVDGEIVEVVDIGGRWMARGYLNRASQIQVRILTWNAGEAIDEAFWRRRLRRAIEARRDVLKAGVTNTCRLVNGESDYLPGLIVDRYGPYLVLQVGTLAIDRRKRMLAEMLLELTGPGTGPGMGTVAVIERSDTTARRQEGLTEANGLLAGAMVDAGGEVEVCENELRFVVDVLGGQKTGFYTDQRENRQRVALRCAGARVLNGFGYTGAFAIYALAAGARSVVNLDSSVAALEMAERNLRLNGFDPDTQTENIAGDLFAVLRDWREDGEVRGSFDMVVLDPPKFVQSKSQLDRGTRGYKDANMLGMQMLRPGGMLATFSCSGLVSADLFQKVVFGAAVDVGREVQIVEWLRQGSDHPVAITFPEGEYLKGLICRVL